MIVRTWRAGKRLIAGLSESEVATALRRLDPLWNELFPAEQARVIQLLVERVDVGPDGIGDIRLRTEGLANLTAELDAVKARGEGSVVAKPKISSDGRTITVRVPISIRKRGGRKLVLAPEGAELTAAPVSRRVDDAVVKAIARAFRWRDMLESGEYATIREIANAEKISKTYVGRVLRLTLLAPEIVEAVLNGTQLPHVRLPALIRPFPAAWCIQLKAIGAQAKSEVVMPQSLNQ